MNFVPRLTGLIQKSTGLRHIADTQGINGRAAETRRSWVAPKSSMNPANM
jgi:hypothetical protein